MLILDEPDVLVPDGPAASWHGLDAGGLLPVEHLFMTVRAWCDAPPSGHVARDSDPLYRMHGDPRD